MPICVECGADVPRAEMYGTGDDLRCGNCAAMRRRAHAPVPRPVLRVDGRVTLVLISFAGAIFLLDLLLKAPPGAAAFPLSQPRQFLAAIPEAVWDGEIWRLVTSAFVHADGIPMGLIHFGFNAFWLWRFGPVIEAWLGPLRYVLVILLLAAGPIAAEILVTGGAPVGLSGVVYGLFGILMALRRTKDFAAQQMDPSTVQVMGVMFVLGILLTWSNTQPIANVAHGAGAVIGWLLGRATQSPHRVLMVAAVSASCLLLIANTFYMPWNARYCQHRAFRALRAGDVAETNKWLELLNRRMGGRPWNDAPPPLVPP